MATNLFKPGREAEGRKHCLEMSAWQACAERDKPMLKTVLHKMGRQVGMDFLNRLQTLIETDR